MNKAIQLVTNDLGYCLFLCLYLSSAAILLYHKHTQRLNAIEHTRIRAIAYTVLCCFLLSE